MLFIELRDSSFKFMAGWKRKWMKKFQLNSFSSSCSSLFSFMEHFIDYRWKKVMKIDHHRGPVVCVEISSTSDVLVSGSTDSTICLWSLETYELLNLLQFNSPVHKFCLSPDSVSVERFAFDFASCIIYSNFLISSSLHLLLRPSDFRARPLWR